MKWFVSATFILLTVFFLPSCEVSCNIGNKDDEPKGKAIVQDDARIYNNIKLTTHRAKLKRAYLEFADGTRVPDDNFVDFTQPVKLMLAVDSGWVEQNGYVFLGAAEKIIEEDGAVILEEKDLFESYRDGIRAGESRLIFLTAALKLKKDSPPTSFSVQFRLWDKNGDGYIEGSYMLFSK